MKKAFDQTVRDLKRGVNKSVLKVPAIEQKVLDATSNEPWGPHGSLLADIAQASRNYHEYQIITSIIWKRINDTGKNWRHVYKALIVLEYLVAHGSERAIDDIREHAYQISTLSDFQYIDSSGKDQGNNVRRKSQSLVALVNDKERIQEVREKAAANRDKYRGPPTNSMYRPGSGGYGDRYNDDSYEGRYGNRDDDQNGYGRDRDWGSKDDRYGRYGDAYGRDGDRYGRDYEERYGRDGYRDDDYRGRDQSTDEYNYNSRSRSIDQERDRASEEEGHLSSRRSGAKADDHSQEGSLDRKSPGQNPGAPPSYEDAVSASRSPTYSDRDGDSSLPNAAKEFSQSGASPGHTTAEAAPASTPASVYVPAPAPTPASSQSAVQHSYNEIGAFDEFDPRGSFSAAPPTSSVAPPAASSVEMDLLGSLSQSFSSNSLALVPTHPPDISSEANVSESVNPGPSFAAASSASAVNNQSFDDPFGDSPFKATPSTETSSMQPKITTPLSSVNANSIQGLEPAPQNSANEFGSTYFDATYMPSDPSDVQPPASTEFPKQEFAFSNQEVDILASILPPAAPPSIVNAQGGYPLPPNQSLPHSGFPPQTNQSVQNASPNSFPAQTGQLASSLPQTGQTMPMSFPLQAGQPSQMGFHPQTGSIQLNAPQANFYGAYSSQPTGPANAYTKLPQSGSAVFMTPKMGPQGQSSSISAAAAPSSKDKFETKSSVWADTLSRGLVNLDISGNKANPMADIGVDFDSINRKEKRMEKPTKTTVTSTVTMGQAMGSGSGLGRTSMNMGMAGGPGAGIGMGGYGINRPMGMGMNMNMSGNTGVGMNMQRPMGFPFGSTMPGAYNHMTGTGSYGQQPYGGGYQ